MTCPFLFKNVGALLLFGFTIVKLEAQELIDNNFFINTGREESISDINFLGEVHPKNFLNEDFIVDSSNIVLDTIVISHDFSIRDSIRFFKKSRKLLAKSVDFYEEDTSSIEILEKRINPPVKGKGFKGNFDVGWTPTDNSIAISESGLIISVINSYIDYYDITGNKIFSSNFKSFVKNNSTHYPAQYDDRFFDPKVIYDPIADRFILVFLNGPGNSDSSYVMVYFSKTNNPMNGWFGYTLSGNPFKNSCWFDYPNIGISQNELYITGNLFKERGGFYQSVLICLNKRAGYTGIHDFDSRTAKIWRNILGAASLFPISAGDLSNYGPGVILVSASGWGGNTMNLYHLTNDIPSNPALRVLSLNVPLYVSPKSAYQMGSSKLLDLGDCRIKGGYFKDGVIHFVQSAVFNQGWCGIQYYRLFINPRVKIMKKEIGIMGQHNAYPNIVSFTDEISNKTSLIAYCSSSTGKYPEVNVIKVDDHFDLSEAVKVVSETFQNFPSVNTVDRWGDYIGLARRYGTPLPSVFVAGPYGSSVQNNRWATWINEIH